MVKRSSYEIKQKILLKVKEQDVSYANLERNINTGFRTIKANCEELKDFGQINIKKIEKHPSNGRTAYIVSITKQGINFLNKAKKK